MLNRQIVVWTAIATLTWAPAAALAEDAQARFTFSVPGEPESTLNPADGRFRLTVNRWSTDQERDNLRAAVAEPETLVRALGNAGVVGYLQWPGGLEYSVRYARRLSDAGGQDIVLLLDRGLWVWWDERLAGGTQAPWSVVQIRIGKDNQGEGRAAFGRGVVAHAEGGIALETFTAEPVLLREVRAERES